MNNLSGGHILSELDVLAGIGGSKGTVRQSRGSVYHPNQNPVCFIQISLLASSKSLFCNID